MTQIGMLALRDFTHTGAEYHRGQYFTVAPVTAAIIRRTGHARLTSKNEDAEYAQHPVEVTKELQVETSSASTPKRKRRYRRRDLKPTHTK